MFEAYKDKVIFLVVYIREAHPASSSQNAETAGWKAIKLEDGKSLVYHQPKTYEDRQKLAKVACTYWDLPIPTLVDTMEPSIGLAYQSWPNRIYFIGKDGKIIYRGSKGPRGATPRPAEEALVKHFGIKGKLVSEEPRGGSSSKNRDRSGSTRPNQRQRR